MDHLQQPNSSTGRHLARCAAMALLLLGAAAHADRYDDVVNAESRADSDRQRDALRQPLEVLRQVGVDRGQTVLDIGAGGGYYSEMLSALVGDDGQVYLQNPQALYDLFPNLHSLLTDQRLGGGRLANVNLWDHEATQLELEDASVDLVFVHLIYHDMFWIYPDRVGAVNAELLRVLKPGGRLVIIDHAAAAGSRDEHARVREGGLHRLDADFVKATLTDTGFELASESDLLAHPEDDRSQVFFSEALRGKPTDRFFHIYRKPSA